MSHGITFKFAKVHSTMGGEATHLATDMTITDRFARFDWLVCYVTSMVAESSLVIFSCIVKKTMKPSQTIL